LSTYARHYHVDTTLENQEFATFKQILRILVNVLIMSSGRGISVRFTSEDVKGRQGALISGFSSLHPHPIRVSTI